MRTLILLGLLILTSCTELPKDCDLEKKQLAVKVMETQEDENHKLIELLTKTDEAMKATDNPYEKLKILSDHIAKSEMIRQESQLKVTAILLEQ